MRPKLNPAFQRDMWHAASGAGAARRNTAAEINHSDK